MEKIDTIEIKNFKSIRHQKIEGCKRINVFIGYPNVGKSNILEALGLFSIDDSNLDFSSFVRIENITTLFYDGDIAKQSEVRINEKHRFVIRLKSDSLLFEQQFDSAGTSFEKDDAGTLFPDGIYPEEKGSFQLTEMNRSIVDYKSSKGKRENELRSVRKYEFGKKIQYSKRGYSPLSYPYGNNIFNVISSDLMLKEEISELFSPYNLELLYESREQKFTILKRTQTGIFSIPYELLADTLQRLIFFKAAIKSNKDAILLFEEPEAHMFPPYISKFTGSVWDSDTNQFFIATHSATVINDFFENCRDELNIYWVYYLEGETKVKKLSDENLDTIYNMGTESVFYNLEKFSIDENIVHA